MTTGKLFSAEQKASLALESLTKHNGREVVEREGITPNLLTRWENELVKHAATIFKQSDASAERMAKMEQLIGRMVVDGELDTMALVVPRQRMNGHAEPVLE